MEASSARSGTQSDARHARMLARARDGFFLTDFFLISRAAFDTLERAKHWTAFHVAQTIIRKCASRCLGIKKMRREMPCAFLNF